MDTKMILSTVAILLTLNGVTHGQQAADVQPRELIVREGEAFQFVCRTGQEIDSCRIELPDGKGISLKPGIQAQNLGIEYFGDGFKTGQCGLKMQQSDASSNGVYKCSMTTATSIFEIQGRMKLTVARPPMAPELRLFNRYADYPEYNEGDMLNAECIVRNGRPAANITWFIGDEPIHSGLQAPYVGSEDPSKPDLQSVAQNLSRPVSWRDHGKKLRCVAQHIGNTDHDQSMEADIQVRFAPQPSERTPIELYGFEEGKEGVITYIVIANPRPDLQWRVNNKDIIEGESNDGYDVEVARPLEMGRYEARLRINRVSNSDINKDFRLTAKNELGTQIYTIKISTQPAATETDLSSLAIVAIVIVVFIIFVLIVLVFFAFRTKRWCFAAGVPSRSDKESLQKHPSSSKIRQAWERLTYRKVDTTEPELPPIPITLPPETPSSSSRPRVVASSISTQSAQETDLDTLERAESAGALHSSDTESADHNPAATEDEVAAKKRFKMPAFLAKNKQPKQQQTPMDEVKVAPTDEKKSNDAVVYAELDLATGRKAQDIPVIRREDDKTEYAEIVHKSKPV